MNKGQWIRTPYGIIHRILGMKNGDLYIKISNTKGDIKYMKIDNEEDYKVADDPRELVEVGDLVKINNNMDYDNGIVVKIKNKDNSFLGFLYDNDLNVTEVVAIWTLNENGNYIKQWEMK